MVRLTLGGIISKEFVFHVFKMKLHILALCHFAFAIANRMTHQAFTKHEGEGSEGL